MHAEQSGDALIDRELAAALAVEPSAEFLARVRMRIAREPEPSAWRRSWTFAAAGACATAIAIGLSVQMHQTPPPDPDRVPQPSTLFANLSAAAPDVAPAPLAIAVSAARRDKRSKNEKPTPAMQAIMKSNTDASTALNAHVEEGDYDAIVRDAATYKQNFAYIEAFWTNKQVDGAVTLSRSGLMAAADIETAALARDDAAVMKAMAVLAGTCGVCHKQHREQLPDKTYEIRL